MQSLEDQVEAAINNGVIPGVVLQASNGDGTFSYSRSIGARSPRSNEPLDCDTVVRLASVTKLFTQICAMQCVERGMIGLDDDVTTVLTELKDIDLLTGFEGDKPVTRKPKEIITLRRLLSHSSGWSADIILEPLMIQWRKIYGTPDPPTATFNDRMLYPLTFEPGSKWAYANSIDWAGRLVERLNSQSLDEYVSENIAKPLGSQSMTFYAQKRPDLLARRAEFAHRPSGEGKKLELGEEWYYGSDPKDCYGGMGLWATSTDLMQVCKSLLANDGRLLKRDSIREGFRSQLSDDARNSMAEFLKNEAYDHWGMGGGFQYGSKRDAGLFGMLLTEENEKTPRKAGCIAWIGYPNVFYFIDPKADLCGVFTAQITPPGDAPTRALHLAWEKAVYKAHEEWTRERADGRV